MTHTHTHTFFLTKIIQKLLFICSILCLGFLFSTHTFAELVVGDTTGSDQIQNNGTHSFGPKVIYLREPMIPGKETIDVSPDTSGGAIGIMSQYVTMVYKYVLALGSIVAVLVIMFGGIKMMTSGGDSGATGEAKEMIMQTLQGLAMLFLAGLFLYAINPNFFVFGGNSTNPTVTSTVSSNTGAVR